VFALTRSLSAKHSCLVRQTPDALLHHAASCQQLVMFSRGCPCPGYRCRDRDGSHVVQKVLGDHGLRPDPSFGERDVLWRFPNSSSGASIVIGNTLASPTTVVGTSSGWSFQNDVLVTDAPDQVGGVSSAGAFHVVLWIVRPLIVDSVRSETRTR